MSEIHAISPQPRRPLAERVRRVNTDEPFRWLAAGWADFRAARGASIAYGLIFVVAGLVLAAALFAANMIYLFVPLATGFLIIGPALTIGFYAISRDLERGEAPSFTRAVLAFRANPGPLFYVGLVLLYLLLLWVRLAQLAFALSFPAAVGLDLRSLVDATLFTPDGQVFLAISVAMGAVIAALTFAGGAFSLPLLLDRPVGMVEAVATSWTAVMTNLPAMAVWAAVLVVLTGAGMAAGFVGLAVTLPLAGHATWHAYRSVIRQESDVRSG
jgi:uncharacterized membrane protein